MRKFNDEDQVKYVVIIVTRGLSRVVDGRHRYTRIDTKMV